jgi:hypothetical protein
MRWLDYLLIAVVVIATIAAIILLGRLHDF